MNAQTNPLLDFSDLPRFDAFAPEFVTPAIDTLLAECREVVARLEAATDAVNWINFVEPLEQEFGLRSTHRIGQSHIQMTDANVMFLQVWKSCLFRRRG